MDDFVFKRATLKDVDFVADIIINAEKSSTDRNGFANLFELQEDKFKELIIKILEEEIEGCELSLSNFILAYHNDKPVAGMGGWLEGYPDNMPSEIIKSNLIGYFFPREVIMKSVKNSEVYKDIQIPREKGAYQLEYGYVKPEYTGYGLFSDLDELHIKYALSLDPKPTKIQGHVCAKNKVVIKIHELEGFKVVKEYKSTNPRTIEFYPDDTIVLIEKML